MGNSNDICQKIIVQNERMSDNHDIMEKFNILMEKMEQLESTISIIEGCIDPKAMNYNSNANKDDGSCRFAKIITNLEFGDYDKTNNIVPLLIDNNDPISGFQVSISGAIIMSVFGGISETVGFVISNSSNTAMGYSLNGNTIYSGKDQTLINLEIKPKSKLFNKVCIENVELSDSHGHPIYQTDESLRSCFKP